MPAAAAAATTAARTGLFDLIDRLNKIAVANEFNLDIAQITKELFVYDKINISLQVFEICFFQLIQCETKGRAAAAITRNKDPDILGTFLTINDFGYFNEGFRISFHS